ncbi:MAG: VWA domain-containing protein [Proteobacteria bacterium]|nr:VWA domain-containing protein [Pseudomonadota bacterium]
MIKKLETKDFVNIRIVLDRSGSMGSAVKETIDSINTFIKEQQSARVNGSITISTFDSGSIEVPIKNVLLKDMGTLDYAFLDPRGSTPLLDALGLAINEHGNHSIEENEKKSLVIVTDGRENASREYTNESIKKLIEEKTNEGWLIVYLGADHDAFSQSKGIGIEYDKTLNYSKLDSVDAMRATSRKIRDYSRGVDPKTIKYENYERDESFKKKKKDQN